MRINRLTSGKRWRTRPDGMEKVTGQLKYLTDLQAPEMLYGKVLRSPHPHAVIKDIRIEKASMLKGVHAVITHLDVPGLNRFGIETPDQPVLCEDRVRYIGDAVAAVAAETEELADYALTLIEVDYELLPVIDDPEAALLQESVQLHPNGNVLHRTNHKVGNIETGFANSAFIVEETYSTPRQMHTYMEMEGGLFIPEADGRLTVYSATQHGYMDQFQLSRILAIPQTAIRIVSSPIGGSFGGKDELNVQPYGALLAVISGRPVKIHNSRWESFRAGLKRHPMKIHVKTGVDSEGRIMAHQARIVADTGAYATLGGPVLNFATEHMIGLYTMPNVAVEGISVFTNNGVSGEFRGFGGNQAIFALECQMDRLAEKLGMDPWALRQINLRDKHTLGPLGQRIAPTDGASQVWDMIDRSELWASRTQLTSVSGNRPSAPWLKYGIGAALTMHGAGLGYGIPDDSGGRIVLSHDGKIEVVFGFEEFGQGLIATLELMLIEHFDCQASDLRLLIGDTDLVPQSGSSTASRATSMMWMALQRLKPLFLQQLLTAASHYTGVAIELLTAGPEGVWRKADLQASRDSSSPLISYQDISAKLSEPIAIETKFHYPITPDPIMGGHFLYTYAAVAVKVEVNTLTGRVRLLDQFHAVAAGPVANPQGYLGQIEGGSIMALGFTLTEDAQMHAGEYITRNLDTYLIPTASDIHRDFELEAIEELPEEDTYGPRGVGEVGTVVLAPAIASAVYHAVGKRINKLPISPEELQQDFIIPKGVFNDEHEASSIQ
ncbi:xanthine dehydrogenase subunit D [Paenibacillus sp. GP183]|uniref:xanthine dehydrogenase subunit D n=1 Tax=Paenibacillus sp. GP183 TaxID=1882751 RepID=UPI00089C509B|nr:xanthine dehydrogenase subunit D [Paenibacillus sp. GP183]SEB52203.1 xanthine dehydrogenase, molybdenum binding subunit apoprotein [Paenibacillus sp. GP183]